MSSLATIKAQFNRISVVSADLVNLTKLTELDLSDNQLTQLPDNVGNVSMDTMLYLTLEGCFV